MLTLVVLITPTFVESTASTSTKHAKHAHLVATLAALIIKTISASTAQGVPVFAEKTTSAGTTLTALGAKLHVTNAQPLQFAIIVVGGTSRLEESAISVEAPQLMLSALLATLTLSKNQ